MPTWARSTTSSVSATWWALCFSHGNPIKPENFDYVFTPEQAQELLSHGDQLNQVTLIGQSHLTKSFKLTTNNSESSVEELQPDKLTLEPPSKYVVAVGSVGQPRDNDARACFTVVDLDARTLRFHRAEYDIYASAEAIWRDDNLAPDFGKRPLPAGDGPLINDDDQPTRLANTSMNGSPSALT